MEAYSSSSSSSATSRQQMPHYAAALHAVRRSGAGAGAAAKAWKKPAVAPLPPTPPRVYKVDPVNFRDLVQRLTAAPEFSADASAAAGASRIHAMAPPPVDVAAAVHRPMPAKAASLSTVYKEFSEALVEKAATPPQPHGGSFLGLNLSPPTNTAASHSWCSYPMLSPGTLSNLEHSTVL